MLSQFLSVFVSGMAIANPAVICTSSMDDAGNTSGVECREVELPPNTGNMPETFTIPEGDRK